MTVKITSGTGRGQEPRITQYWPNRMATVVNPDWDPPLGSSSRYAVTGPQVLDTLFLVGRTNTEPPVVLPPATRPATRMGPLARGLTSAYPRRS